MRRPETSLKNNNNKYKECKGNVKDDKVVLPLEYKIQHKKIY